MDIFCWWRLEVYFEWVELGGYFLLVGEDGWIWVEVYFGWIGVDGRFLWVGGGGLKFFMGEQ